jgi:hypothetical protein
VVTATNAAGGASASSNTIAVITVPVNSVAPVVSGSTAVGSTLTTTNGSWTYSPSSYAYQWLSNGANIAGATSSAYVTVSGDYTNAISCRVTATNAAGSASATSSNSITVTLSPPVNTVAPAITGTPSVGNVLTCSAGTWSNSPTSYAYQWKRNTVNIAGATASAYTVVSADNGNELTCLVTATNAAGNGTALSNIADVGNVPWTPAFLPTLVAWYDATQAASVILNGSTVSQWNDQTSNGYNVSQGTAANQPTYGATSLNGNAGITFNGTTNSLRGAIPVSTFPTGFSFYSVGFVQDRVSANNAAPFLRTSTNLARPFDRWDATVSINGTTNATVVNLRYQMPTVLGLIGMGYDNSTTTYTSWLNGAALNSVVMTGATYSDSSNANIQFGSRDDSSSYMKGAIGETVITPVLSTTNRQRLEGYLAWKWRAPDFIPLPTTHPYYMGPPDDQGNVITQAGYTTRLIGTRRAPGAGPASGAGNAVTTASMDTTGAKLLVAFVGYFQNTTTPTISDSKGNTWVVNNYPYPYQSSATAYCLASPVVGTGHTFTVSGGTWNSLVVLAFTLTGTPTYQTSTHTNYGTGGTAATAGSITPTGNAIMITGLSLDPGAGAPPGPIDSGFRQYDAIAGQFNACQSIGVAWNLVSSGTATNPIWTSPNARRDCVLMCFNGA